LTGLIVDWELQVEVPVQEQMMSQQVAEMKMGWWLQDVLVDEQTWEQHEYWALLLEIQKGLHEKCWKVRRMYFQKYPVVQVRHLMEN
jgi:hypothetical protein